MGYNPEPHGGSSGGGPGCRPVLPQASLSQGERGVLILMSRMICLPHTLLSETRSPFPSEPLYSSVMVSEALADEGLSLLCFHCVLSSKAAPGTITATS